MLVIHGISLPPGEFGGSAVKRLFCNCLDPGEHPFFAEIQAIRVSPHLFIDRTGTVLQFVSVHRRAWHAGRSRFAGRDNCNDFSIGIELEGVDELNYTDQQYQSLTLVTRAMRRAYPAITDDRIVGHCDVAPGRKSDPGPAFDWAYFRAALNNEGGLGV